MSVSVSTLFEKLGGAPAIETVVKEFYNRVLGDPNLRGFFDNTDMDKQTESQIRFLTMALGGPNEYRGRDMKTAHEHMAITEFHFELVASHLISTLQWAGVAKGDIDEVVALVAPLQADIVTA